MVENIIKILLRARNDLLQFKKKYKMRSISNFFIFLLCLHLGPTIHAEQPTTLFCHGIIDNHTQMNRYADFIMKPKKAFDFPDAQTPTDLDLNTVIFTTGSQFGKSINRNNMAMGYGIDIQTLKHQIDCDQEYILYGVSRGGATIINYLADYNPKNIAGIILDAAPADVVDSIDFWQHAIGYLFAPDRATQETIFHSLFPAYPKNSIPSVQAIANISNKKLPVFIVNSQDDARVPIASAWELYIAFLQAGFEHVYLCQLTTGVHANYMQGPDKNIYLTALHSFYKTHEFDYNPHYATLKSLRDLQPSIDDIIEKLSVYKEKMERNYQIQKAKNRNYFYLTIAGLIGTGIAYHINHS